jgi:hypothetical protein
MHRDPASMSEVERLDELAGLLARGAQRYFAAKIKGGSTAKKSPHDLDALASVEAACRSRVHDPQSRSA